MALGRRARGYFAEIQRANRAGFSYADQGESTTADIASLGIAHRKRETDSDGDIKRVAPLLKDLFAYRGCVRRRGRERAVVILALG